MEIIEITATNIDTYIDQCITVQSYLVSDASTIDADFFKATAAEPTSYFLGVLDDAGILLGMGVLSKVVHPVRINGYINNIVVHPDARGRGLFSIIMDTLEEKAKEWDCTRIELTCSRDAVQGMYEKRGYTKKDTNFYFLSI